MRAEKQWVDHPAPTHAPTSRPHLRLIATPPSEGPDSPSQKAAKSISEKTEITLVVLAQVILILGMFMASMFIG